MTKAASMPLLAHLDELRSRVMKSAVAIVAGTIVSFFLRNRIFDLLAGPWNKLADHPDLVFFKPGEAFSVFMRLSLFGGFVLAAPVVIYQVWAFITPALKAQEKKVVVPAMAALSLLFVGGIVAGYWALARGLAFLIDFGGDRLVPTIGASFYLQFAMRFILAFGIAFEFPVFLFSAAALGLVRRQSLVRGRRWAVLIIVTLAAIITPSGDPVTLMLLSVPLYALYELTLLLIKLVLRR